jgi:hypothetical protein
LPRQRHANRATTPTHAPLPEGHDRFEFSNGVLKVFPPHEDKPLLTLKSGDENFFPGYFLLQQLTGKAAAVESA